MNNEQQLQDFRVSAWYAVDDLLRDCTLWCRSLEVATAEARKIFTMADSITVEQI